MMDEKPKPRPRYAIGEMVLTSWDHAPVRVWKIHRQFSPYRYRVVGAEGNCWDVREDGLITKEDTEALKRFHKSGKVEDLKSVSLPRKRIY